MKYSRLIRTAAIGAACAVVGAGAGIAGSSAATNSKSSSSKTARASHLSDPLGGPFRRGGDPPVHSETVVPNKAGDGFITVTTDFGTVKSVSGDELTITEGTKTLTYKDATITIPSDATVYRNGSAAALGDLQAGDHVRASRSSEGTFVEAFDSQHQPRPLAGPRSRG